MIQVAAGHETLEADTRVGGQAIGGQTVIPLPQILAEFIMALGGALFLASLWALLRPRAPREGDEPVIPPARGRVLINAFIGLIVLVWGFASFVTHGSS